jgi:8-oxo-dGTP diphosphatase
VAALLRRRGRVLVVHQSPRRQWYPDTWDLPGGSGLPGEAPSQALVRALGEQLGIVAEVAGDPLAHVRGADFRKDIWLVDRWAGEPTGQDPRLNDALAWLTDLELHGLTLADSRLPQLLRLALDEPGG